MDRKTLGIAGVVLALGALVRPGASVGEKHASPAAVDRGRLWISDAACNAADDGPWKALDHFFTLKKQPSGKNHFGVPATAPHFLIASVPDPVSTHLALDFDRALESIILAAGDSKFSFQRHWTPWRTAPEKEPALLADRKCLEQEDEERLKQPGLLAFQDWNGQSLLVFLVGESPTAGVRQEQLIHALDDIRLLSGLGREELVVGVVGPSFSGSLRSLAPQVRALKNVAFHFVSGMVTAEKEIANFKAGIKASDNYESTLESDQRATKLFLKYAKTQWHPKARMVLLNEGETAYGNSLDLPSDADGLAIRYPREISRLRNAYQEESAPAQKGGNEGAETAPAVRFTLKDSGSDDSRESDKDAVPAFSRLQSPASQQAVMASIATTIRRERADFVGIVATDVLDALFLSRFLRSSCPDTRLFTPDADLLFSVHPDGESLEGLLSVTTYPLFSRNQLWTRDPQEGDLRTPFASRYAEGTYNASRRLLDDKAPLIEYTWPGERTGRPPLWLTVMGREGYWPLALLDEKVQDGSDTALLQGPKPQAGGAIYPEPPGRGWYLCFWLCQILSALHCVYLGFVFGGKPRLQSGRTFCLLASRWLFPAYPEPGDEISAGLRVFLTAATLSIGCAAVILDAPLWAFAGWPPHALWVDFYAALGGVTAVALFGTALALCWKSSIWRYSPNTAILASGLWIIAAATVLVWVSLVRAAAYRSGYFFAYRCFALTSAVAPNIPILLLAIALYYWSVMQLRREGNVEQKKKGMQRAHKQEEIPGEALMGNVDRAFGGLFSRVVWLPAILFLLVCVLLFVPWRTLRSFELERYDWLLVGVLATVYWATAVTWMQFLWCWNEFHVFLQWLETHPIRSAFSRLPKEIPWVPLVTNPPERALFISTRAFDCVQALEAFDGSGLKTPNRLQELKESIRPDAREIERLFLEIDKNRTEAIDRVKYDDLQAHLQSVALKIVADLEDTSWREGDSDSLDAEREKSTIKKKPAPDEALLILKEEFVAFRYLMFIRQVFRDLRNLLGFIIVGFILAVISLSSYTFQGHRWIGVASTIALLAIGTGVAVVLAGMDRDAILSRISATKPNEVGVTFYLRLAQFGALPLLTLLASQFPALNRFLFSWVQPALESLK